MIDALSVARYSSASSALPITGRPNPLVSSLLTETVRGCLGLGGSAAGAVAPPPSAGFSALVPVAAGSGAGFLSRAMRAPALRSLKVSTNDLMASGEDMDSSCPLAVSKTRSKLARLSSGRAARS